MVNTTHFNIDNETIDTIGLWLSGKDIDAQIAPDAGIFEYPGLDNLYVMESDLYGNTMPDGACFLASFGNHGLMGRHLKIDTLKHASKEEIKAMQQAES